LICASVYFVGGSICIGLLETDIQPWAVIEKKDQEKLTVDVPIEFLKKKDSNYF
jgi:hypothetical protein